MTARRELGKWLNEQPNRDVDRVALAELLTEYDAAIDAARYEAIGWCHAFCCAALDDGKDPRQIDCAEMLEKARIQLDVPNK